MITTVLKETSNGFEVCSMLRNSQNIDGGHQRASQKRKKQKSMCLCLFLCMSCSAPEDNQKSKEAPNLLLLSRHQRHMQYLLCTHGWTPTNYRGNQIAMHIRAHRSHDELLYRYCFYCKCIVSSSNCSFQMRQHLLKPCWTMTNGHSLMFSRFCHLLSDIPSDCLTSAI